MKHYIAKATQQDNSKSSIIVLSIDEVTHEEVRTPLNRRTSDGYVYLPDFVVNATNRRMFKIANAQDEPVELTQVAFREARVLGSRRSEAEKRPLESFLEDESERATFVALKAKAEKAREEYINHVPTELEIAQAQLAKYEALVAKLKSEQK